MGRKPTERTRIAVGMHRNVLRNVTFPRPPLTFIACEFVEHLGRSIAIESSSPAH